MNKKRMLGILLLFVFTLSLSFAFTLTLQAESVPEGWCCSRADGTRGMLHFLIPKRAMCVCTGFFVGDPPVWNPYNCELKCPVIP